VSASPLSFWLGHALVSALCATVVALLAPRLHRVLGLSHAAHGYWLGAWLLAVLPTPIAMLLQWAMPIAVTSALPTLVALGDMPDALIEPGATLADGPSAIPLGLALLLLYGSGVVIAGMRWLIALRQLRAILRSALPIELDDLRGRARDEFIRLDARGIRLLMTQAAMSPFALCWPRSIIVVPHTLLTRLDDEQLRLVLRHEAAHLARRDPQWGLLMHIVGVLLWFNPALRSLARRVQLAAELACDRAALAGQKNMRRAYAEAYLEALRMSMTRALACPAIAFSPQTLGSHRMRLEHIVNGDPHARKRPLLSTALAGIALALGASLVTVQAATDVTRPPVVFSGPIIEGRVSSAFGTLRPNISRQAHRGIDLTAARGTAVNAPATGTVLVATASYEIQPNYGTVIILDHGDGWQTLYAHLDSLDVAAGDRVDAGQRIGRVGSTGQATGPHVHVEVLRHGERIDPASVIATPVASN
jgi:beta-lactamase regulating signal transducer with metallopeptidase domain